jgi:hypothetical protein
LAKQRKVLARSEGPQPGLRVKGDKGLRAPLQPSQQTNKRTNQMSAKRVLSSHLAS